MDLSPFLKLDKVIHEQGRLRIMSVLAPVESLTFKELRDRLDMTDGNLSVHMRTLEENGYVCVHKEFVERKPRTTYSLTREGRQAFAEYIDTLAAIVEQSRGAEQPVPKTAVPRRGQPRPAAE